MSSKIIRNELQIFNTGQKIVYRIKNWHERVAGMDPCQGTPLAMTHTPMGLKDDMAQRNRSTFALRPPTVTL
jgi:hypothetical protein